VVMSKASASHALPLMIHDSCVVWLDGASGRVSPMRLASLFSEIGQRTYRNGIGQCVFALSQKKSAERDSGLAAWVEANPNDVLAGSIRAALQNNTTENIHSSFAALTRQLMKPSKSLNSIVGGVSKVPFPPVSKKLVFAALGFVTVGVLGFTLNGLVSEQSVTKPNDVQSVGIEGERASEVQIASLDTAPLEVDAIVDPVTDLQFEPTDPLLAADQLAQLPQDETPFETADMVPAEDDLAVTLGTDDFADLAQPEPVADTSAAFPDYEDTSLGDSAVTDAAPDVPAFVPPEQPGLIAQDAVAAIELPAEPLEEETPVEEELDEEIVEEAPS